MKFDNLTIKKYLIWTSDEHHSASTPITTQVSGIRKRDTKDQDSKVEIILSLGSSSISSRHNPDLSAIDPLDLLYKWCESAHLLTGPVCSEFRHSLTLRLSSSVSPFFTSQRSEKQKLIIVKLKEKERENDDKGKRRRFRDRMREMPSGGSGAGGAGDGRSLNARDDIPGLVARSILLHPAHIPQHLLHLPHATPHNLRHPHADRRAPHRPLHGLCAPQKGGQAARWPLELQSQPGPV